MIAASFFALSVWCMASTTRNSYVGPYVCPKCGAAYPAPGICHGYGTDKHAPVKAVPR